MTQPNPFGNGPAEYDAASLQAVITMSEELGRTIHIAQVLLEHGRTVDLTGLDRGVGLLCAKALDLTPENGRAARPHLTAILAASDALEATLRRDGQGR